MKAHEDSSEVRAMTPADYRALMQRFAAMLEQRHEDMRAGRAHWHYRVQDVMTALGVAVGTVYTMCGDANAHDFDVFLAAWHGTPADAVVEWGGRRRR